MKVIDVGVGDGEVASWLDALHLEHQSFFAAEAADVAFPSCQGAVEHTDNLIGLVILVGIESVISIGSLQYHHLVGVVVIEVHERPHLFFRDGEWLSLLVFLPFAFVAQEGIGVAFLEKIPQRAFRGQHEDIAVEEGELALLVTMPHVDRGMGGAVGFQDVVGVFLLAVDEAAQLPFMSGLGTDKIPMVVDVVALVCHKVLVARRRSLCYPHGNRMKAKKYLSELESSRQVYINKVSPRAFYNIL